jgi:putative heme-binding domain-containing protein
VSDRRHILESILLPSNVVAPRYHTWQIETTDGKIRTGMLIGTNLDEYTYVDTKGDTFKLNTRTIAESRSLPTSIRTSPRCCGSIGWRLKCLSLPPNCLLEISNLGIGHR